MKLIETLRNEKRLLWLPYAVALAGALLYLIKAQAYALTTIPGLDEGSYLIKGYLYMLRVYEPFEHYGPLTNKAPFAFLIPGFAEYLFGAGIRTGRTFAIALGLLTLLGTWITARRWAGNWIAAATIWVFALASMVIKIHAITASEVIISCILAWMCVFVLAENRPLWQIIAGALLAALTVLTRQNMALVLPAYVLYVFWQHGKQKGIWAFMAGSALFLAVHVYYWPNILTIWAPWLPDSLTPFLDPFRLPKDATPVWNPTNDFWNRLISFFQGIRYHFIPAVGSLIALLLFRFNPKLKVDSALRAILFTGFLYFTSFWLHAWAAVASQYESYSCVYCFTPYLSFFDPLGILFLVICYVSLWNRDLPKWIQAIAVLIVIIVCTGIGLSMFSHVGQTLLELPVPRMRGGQILEGSTLLKDFLKNAFGWDMTIIKRAISSMLGLGTGLGLLILSMVVWRCGRSSAHGASYGYIFLNLTLIAGFILAPLMNMGSDRDCAEDLITANETVGHYLAEVIPAGSLVYWDGGLSFTPMVYVVPEARIFPIQINDGYTYRIGGDAELLHRFSHWNEELDMQWRAQANVFIIESKRYDEWKEYLSPQVFAEYPRPAVAPSCDNGSGLRIFKRLP